MKKPIPPKHLTGHSREWFKSMVREYDFSDDPHSLALLTEAAAQLARLESYRQAIERDGLIVTDRFNQPKEHPAAVGERSAANLFRLLCRELGLSDDAINETARINRG